MIFNSIEELIEEVDRTAHELNGAWAQMTAFAREVGGRVVVNGKNEFNKEFSLFEKIITGETLNLRSEVGAKYGLKALRSQIDKAISKSMILAMEKRPDIAISPSTRGSALVYAEELLIWSRISPGHSDLARLVSEVYPAVGIPCGLSSDGGSLKIYQTNFVLPNM